MVGANKAATETTVEVITSQSLRSHHDLVDGVGIYVSQMTTDIFHL
jgi:hypothetical protein